MTDPDRSKLSRWQAAKLALEQVPEFDREMIRTVVLQWIGDIDRDPSASPNLEHPPTCSDLKDQKFATLRRRNLKNANNAQGVVATACSVGIASFRNLLQANPKRKSYGITCRRICLALIQTGRLSPDRQIGGGNYFKTPMPRVAPDLEEKAQELAVRAAAISDPKAASAARERAELAALCDALARDAINADRADLADALSIAKAGAYLKAGAEICRDVTVLRVREEVSRIRQTRRAQALGNAAAQTEYKMLRQLMPTVDDPGLRLGYFKKAANLVEDIKGELRLPIRLMIPGLPNEFSKGIDGVDWGDGTRHPMTLVVHRPLRYQSGSLLEAAVEQWLLDPGEVREIKSMLDRAAMYADLGKARQQVSPSPRVNIASASADVGFIRAMMVSLSGDSQLSGQELCKLTKPFDALQEEIEGERELTPYDRSMYSSLFILARAAMNIRSRERFSAVVMEQVLPRVTASALLRPENRTIITQKACFRMAFFRYPDLWESFLRACGYTKERAKMPSISVEMQIAHSLHRSRKSRGPR